MQVRHVHDEAKNPVTKRWGGGGQLHKGFWMDLSMKGEGGGFISQGDLKVVKKSPMS